MLTESTIDALALGSDAKSSEPTPSIPNPGSTGGVGVAGCMTGHAGTQSTAVVGA